MNGIQEDIKTLRKENALTPDAVYQKISSQLQLVAINHDKELQILENDYKSIHRDIMPIALPGSQEKDVSIIQNDVTQDGHHIAVLEHKEGNEETMELSIWQEMPAQPGGQKNFCSK